MVDAYPKTDCNGCKMCAEICSHNAIRYETDAEGFWYPKVNASLCVRCGLCVKKCPNLTPVRARTQPPDVRAAWSKSDAVRMDSTSGGIFYELARETLLRGGYVAACAYDADFRGAHHALIHAMDDLPPLMTSKHVQSDARGIYAKTRAALETGAPVLFVGAPCQAAALVSFLGREYENLLLCDFVCRGATSPKAHAKYIEYLETRYQSRVISLRSKDKRKGWNHFGQSARFENGAEYYASRNDDLRVVAYHYGNLMMRPSCHVCRFKTIPRTAADITLADFWGIPENEVEDIEKGVSLVMLNTERGKERFDAISHRLGVIPKTLEDALKGNPAILRSAEKGENRDRFLSELDSKPFDALVAQYRRRPPGLGVRILRRLKRGVAKLLGR